MRLLFDNLTLGYNINYGLRSITGLDMDLEDFAERVPRTDYFTDTGDQLPRRILEFGGVIVGNNKDDFRDRIQDFSNRLRKTYLFTLQDGYNTTSGYSVYKEREFTGKITLAEVNNQRKVAHTSYRLQISCTDPFLYAPGLNTISGDIVTTGMFFPLHFPLHFGKNFVDFEVTNNGEVEVYPTYTFYGAASRFSIRNITSGLADPVFSYNTPVTDNAPVVITPNPIDEVKVLYNGNNALRNTNFNFDPLQLQPGVNQIRVSVPTGATANTRIVITFQDAYLSL